MEAAVRSRDVMTDTADMKAQVLQQRLLLLNHSSKCTIAEEQTCPVSRHCGQFKVLWRHILTCKDNACKVIHCLSSRYVLSHYAKCADCDCSICPRVRESAKRESSDASCSPSTSSKKPRSSYWWASETFVQFTKAITVSTNDFINPPPAKSHSQCQSSFATSPYSPYSTAHPLSVEKLNQNMNQMSIGGFSATLPPRRPEGTSLTQSTQSPHTTHTIYASNGKNSTNALDMLASAAGDNHSSNDKPAARPRSNSGASTATIGSSHSAHSGYSYSDYSVSATASVAPSVASTATGASSTNGLHLAMRSNSSSSSALFAQLQPAPFASTVLPQSVNVSSVSVAQGEECPRNYLSSFSSVCSYHGSAPASPYMSPRHSPVNSHLEERFKF